ncbi:MAG: T9SS type A sorting domain-containing protein [Ignavibacteria bacterium]
MKNFTIKVNTSISNKRSATKKYFGAVMTALLFSIQLFSNPVNADVVGVDPSSPTIEVFNQTTWASVSSSLLTMTGFTVSSAQSVTWNSDNLQFYAIVTVTGGTRRLVTVDPGTGVCTDIGLLAAKFSSLTYNSDDGILYAMGGSGAGVGFAASLFIVDITNAATTFLAGPYPVGSFGEVISYNYDDNMIYHWSGDNVSGANMEKISPVFPHLAIPVIQSGAVHSEIQGAVYTGAGVFVATDLVFLGPTNAYTITSAGAVALVAPTPYQVRGLGFIDPLLPVELSAFTASVNDNDITLNWSTASETNNSRFDIERSSENGLWTRAGSVNGNGTITSTVNYSFSDNNLNSGKYNYRLKQIDFNGNFEYFNLSNEVIIGIPVKYELSQNYPNPFNPSTKINYELPNDGNVNITIFDNAGKEVASLVNEFKSAGFYTINFSASSLSSGVYFYKISSGDFSSVKKMMIVK